ncbi:hypothetical protein ACFQ9X_06315 [Catenulispora yoronensis]
MTETVSARRGTLIAGISALALLILVAAFDNSGTRTWRLARMTGERDDTVHSWTATPVQALSALDWRASPPRASRAGSSPATWPRRCWPCCSCSC